MILCYDIKICRGSLNVKKEYIIPKDKKHAFIVYMNLIKK